jgi:hypothetical protein
VTAGGPPEDPWEAARERTREQVREAFAAHRHAALTRTCAFCGREGTTSFEHCPHCGRSYFDKPPRLSRAWRRVLLGAAGVALVALAAWLVPQLVDYRHHSDEQTRAARTQLIAAERARLRAEQRPHHGQAVTLRPRRNAPRAVQLRARRQLVARVEASITADARARIRRGELSGKPPSKTSCGPLARNQVAGDEQDLTKTIGRYSCVAVLTDAVQAGRRVGLFGIPFVAAVDFRLFTYVWCKDNPAANVSERGLAFVRLARACVAARGKAFGTGYMESP